MTYRIAVPCDLADPRAHHVEIVLTPDDQVQRLRAECGAEGDAVMRLGGLSCRNTVTAIRDFLRGRGGVPTNLQPVAMIGLNKAQAILSKAKKAREDQHPLIGYTRTIADEAIASLIERRLGRGPVFVGSQHILGSGRIDVILGDSMRTTSHYAILWDHPSPNPMRPKCVSDLSCLDLETIIRTLPGAVLHRATSSALAGAGGRAGQIDLPADPEARRRAIIGA